MNPRAWLLAGALLLAGCAELPAPVPAPERPDRAAIREFAVQGRFALKVGNEGQTGRIAWSHRPGEEHLLVIAPLGQTLASLGTDDAGASLELADGRLFRAASLDELADRVFGQPLPLTRLPRWVLGLGAGGFAARDPDGRLHTLDEGGWHVEYLAYEGKGPNALPVLLRIVRDGMELKLHLDGWSVPP